MKLGQIVWYHNGFFIFENVQYRTMLSACAYHIFIICPAYTATGSYLPDNLHEYSLKDLLYGNEHGTGHENEILFLEIQDFLTKCGRFNPQS